MDLAFAAILLTASAARAQEATPAQEAIPEEAKLYFQNGVEMLQQEPPNYQDAYYQFKLAYEKSKSWKVLGNLGLCALKLERDGEALEYYNEYLKAGGADLDPDERAALERDLLLLNGNTAIVNFTSTVPNVQLLDTRAGSTAPPQKYSFNGDAFNTRIRAGTHTITVTAPDGKQVTWQTVLDPGTTVEHRFDFTEKPPEEEKKAGPTTPPPPAEQEKPSNFPTRTVGFVAAGVGGALLAGSIVTGLMAKSADNEGLSKCEGSICTPDARDDFQSAKTFAILTNAFLISGGVLAAGGVTMILIGGNSKEQPAHASTPPRLAVTPVVGGLVARGAF